MLVYRKVTFTGGIGTCGRANTYEHPACPGGLVSEHVGCLLRSELTTPQEPRYQSNTSEIHTRHPANDERDPGLPGERYERHDIVMKTTNGQ